MTRELEAVFENGVLRPLEPTGLEEHQRVRLIISDSRPADFNTRQAEMRWLEAHSSEYRGQWVALDGDHLVSHGAHARTVRDQARERGIEFPLMVRVPVTDDPSAGLLQL